MRTLFLGFIFGFFLIKSEANSWYRIQEMFLFKSFHLYGVIASAVIVGFLSLFLIKKYRLKTIGKNEIVVSKKALNYRASLIGGTLFGFGWALTGLCPGTLYVDLASNFLPSFIILIFALIGAAIYEKLKSKLIH